MEGGVPMLNCLVQQTLRSLCTTTSGSSNSVKWVYAVFWRIIPRNYPPPKWDHGGSILERAKGNKRNWILVWEDGFCDFCECEHAGSGYVKGRFGADIFFKMSHEVYSFGEGLVGKVAADNSHKFVFCDSVNDKDAGLVSSWNFSLDPQPRAWEAQFRSGIQTIAIVSVREGIVQLGSFDKVAEDLNLVLSIQRKFSYLQSLSGISAVNRPCLPTSTQHPYTIKPMNSRVLTESEDKRQLIGSKRLYCDPSVNLQMKAINLGYNSPQYGIYTPPQLCSIPPLLPTTTRSIGALLTQMPVAVPSYESLNTFLLNIQSGKENTPNQNAMADDVIPSELQLPDVKVEASPGLDATRGETLGSE